MWIRNMCLGLLFCSGLVCASTVKTGTYVGMQSKRSNLSYYQDEGTYQYVLSFASLASHETMQFHYVGPEQISYGKSYAFKIEPNPFSIATRLEFNSNSDEPLEIQIADWFGRIIHSEQVSLNKGHQSLRIATQRWTAGAYLLTCKQGNLITRKQLIKI